MSDHPSDHVMNSIQARGTIPQHCQLSAYHQASAQQQHRHQILRPNLYRLDLPYTPKMSSSTYPARTGDSRKDFLAVFPQIVDELLTYMKGEGMPQDAVKWFEDVSSIL
jgi:hypothetical protein